MSGIVYAIWSLLPLFFLVAWLWTFARRLMKKPQKESPSYYLGNFIFCAVTLLVAIYIDQNYFENFVRFATFDTMEPVVASWLLYPAILLIAAYLSSLIKKGKERRKTKLPK